MWVAAIYKRKGRICRLGRETNNRCEVRRGKEILKRKKWKQRKEEGGID